jgi:hypothetical protein
LPAATLHDSFPVQTLFGQQSWFFAPHGWQSPSLHTKPEMQ